MKKKYIYIYVCTHTFFYVHILYCRNFRVSVGGRHTYTQFIRGTNGFSNLFRFIVIHHKATVCKKYFSKVSIYIVVTYWIQIPIIFKNVFYDYFLNAFIIFQIRRLGGDIINYKSVAAIIFLGYNIIMMIKWYHFFINSNYKRKI